MLKLDPVAITDVGRKRTHNEDFLGDLIFKSGRKFGADKLNERGYLFAVADGMGGHASGEVASELAINILFDHYYNAPDTGDVYQNLYNAVHEANLQVYQEGTTRGRGKMGTTLTLALVIGNRVIVGNVGDSRTYLIRQGLPARVTHDHSLVQDQIDIGALTPEQAEQSNIRNVITRAIGNIEEVEPDFFEHELQTHDVILLCSDGLHGAVKEQELGSIVATSPNLKDAAQKLVNLANERGGVDNISVMLIGITELGNTIPPILNTRAAYYPPPPSRQATDPTFNMYDPPTDRVKLENPPKQAEEENDITYVQAVNGATKPTRPITAVSPQPTTQKFVANPHPAPPKKSNAGLLASLLLIVLLVGGAGIYFLLNNIADNATPTSTTLVAGTGTGTTPQIATAAPVPPTVTSAPSNNAATSQVPVVATSERPFPLTLSQVSKIRIELKGNWPKETYSVELMPTTATNPIKLSSLQTNNQTNNPVFEGPLSAPDTYSVLIQSSTVKDNVTLNLKTTESFASESRVTFQANGTTLILFINPK